MPSTNIFGSGSSYSTTDYGAIDEKYQGDHVDITFKFFSKDNNGFNKAVVEEKKATLNVMTLRQIKSEPLYKADLPEKKQEQFNYLHQWTFKRTDTQLIVYAGNDELAFMLTSKSGDVMNDLHRLCSHRLFAALPFFNELNFDVLAKNRWGKSIDELRQLPQMTEKKLAYFCQHVESIFKLISREVSLEQLLEMPFNKLKKLIDLSSYQLDKILTIVTMNQILGIDHIAPPVPQAAKSESSDNMRYFGSFGGGSSGDYSYEHSDNELKISFQQKWKCEYEMGELKKELVPQFDHVASKQPTMNLLHRWVQIPLKVEEGTEDNKVQHLYYSPDKKLIIKEKYDIDFPINQLKKDNDHILVYVPYFYELYKEKELIKLGSSFEKLRALNGMTERKLELLTRSMFDTEGLLKLGLKMEELALVEEDRLSYLMKHHSDVKEAAELVDVHEVFGIAPLPGSSFGIDSKSNYTPAFYKPNRSANSSQMKIDEPGKSFCTIL